ncbi:MarR family winged helix-turn-helix transcriptional regulator [Paenibacillus wenxiniae]|uniref:MarR family winged helix-turn-helix transcriptional regulator n=1 Tax=Paenibacillus wenxiniae TaxID=1636843 RepID=A0ABW4RM96_9BACL
MQHDPSIPDTGSPLVDHLVQLTYLIQTILLEAGAEHELSFIQIRLLGILRDREPGMQELAHHLNLDKSSVTGLINRAERRDMVERVPSPTDRRSFSVRLTDKGKDIVRTVGDEIERRIHNAARNLTEAERVQLTTLSAKMLYRD